jgi:hypothetical protein
MRHFWCCLLVMGMSGVGLLGCLPDTEKARERHERVRNAVKRQDSLRALDLLDSLRQLNLPPDSGLVDSSRVDTLGAVPVKP